MSFWRFDLLFEKYWQNSQLNNFSISILGCKTSNILMHFHVSLNVGFLICSMFTIIASKWFLPCVNYNVLFCMGNRFGHFSTKGAAPLIWTKVNWIVLKTMKNQMNNRDNFSISILVCKVSFNILMNFHVYFKVWFSIWGILA